MPHHGNPLHYHNCTIYYLASVEDQWLPLLIGFLSIPLPDPCISAAIRLKLPLHNKRCCRRAKHNKHETKTRNKETSLPIHTHTHTHTQSIQQGHLIPLVFWQNFFSDGFLVSRFCDSTDDHHCSSVYVCAYIHLCAHMCACVWPGRCETGLCVFL